MKIPIVFFAQRPFLVTIQRAPKKYHFQGSNPDRTTWNFCFATLGRPLSGQTQRWKKVPGKVLTLEIGLRWIFRSLISSSIIQTKTLAAKKFWMKIFAHSISTQVEPFPHNKHPLEHGSAFLVANSCAIGQLQWVYGLAIMSILIMECIKPK